MHIFIQINKLIHANVAASTIYTYIYICIYVKSRQMRELFSMLYIEFEAIIRKLCYLFCKYVN